MMNILKKINPLIPKTASNDYHGYKIAQYIFIPLIVLTIVRSCIHLLAQDGGAVSIASLDVSGPAGQNVISIFSQWGLSQLLMGVVYAIVYIRYKNLISICYLFLIIEYVGRMMVGLAKPMVTVFTPPGAFLNYIMVPISICMLILSLMIPKNLRE